MTIFWGVFLVGFSVEDRSTWINLPTCIQLASTKSKRFNYSTYDATIFLFVNQRGASPAAADDTPSPKETTSQLNTNGWRADPALTGRRTLPYLMPDAAMADPRC